MSTGRASAAGASCRVSVAREEKTKHTGLCWGFSPFRARPCHPQGGQLPPCLYTIQVQAVWL